MPKRVTTLELFFDLVFVFTITQLTAVLVEDTSWASLGHVASMLGFIWWMYGGYAWLTNNVDVEGNRTRLVLLLGMAGYMVIALSIPQAYDGAGQALGIGYAIVICVHAGLFLVGASEGTSAAMRALAPYNLLGALMVLTGGAAGGDVQVALWAFVPIFQWFLSGPLASFRSLRTGGDAPSFDIAPDHFVERHGLVMIVAIGESIVAAGIGADGLAIDLELVSTILFALAVSAGLWWAYFGADDDAAAEHALMATPPAERQWVALRAFGPPHFVLLLGVIAAACGLKKVIGHSDEELELAYALTLSGGVAVYLAGDAWFRGVLALGRSGWRATVGALVLLTVPLGTEVAAEAQLAAVAALLVAMLVIEARKSATRADQPKSRAPSPVPRSGS